MRRSTNRSSLAEPQIWFRIVHVAAHGHHRALGTAYREQTVGIALGPKGAFKKGSVGAMTRRVAVDRVVSALPEPRGRPNPPKEPKTPRVVELLRRALEWQGLIESGDVRNQAEIARRKGITRARVTQAMGLLRLAPEIQEEVLAMPESVGQPQMADLGDQKLRFQELSALLDQASAGDAPGCGALHTAVGDRTIAR